MKTINLVASGFLWATLSLLLICTNANAQTQTPRYQSIIANSNGFYEYLPQGYNNESQSYPLLVFVTGVGELGDGSPTSLPSVLKNGPPKLINSGTFPVSFTAKGEVFKFIIISPQFKTWPVADDIQGVIDYAVKTYRVNTNRIYLTGLSMGGGVTWDYCSFKAAYANRVAAVVPVSGASGPTADKVNVIVSSGLPVWALHNQGDDVVPVTNTISYVDNINASSPPPAIPARKTIFQVAGHDAWSTSYDPAYKENNLNVYEWMLQYQRGNTPVNQLPVSFAGSDVTVTLPGNSVTLAGSGTDNDGSITGYAWSKISGPSQFSINNGAVADPTISNLVAGDYVFRLTVSDNSGATAYDDISISEKAAPVAAAPIPGSIESENYSAMNGVQTENTSDDGGGKDVGWTDAGDWMDYQVNVANAGSYSVNFKVATPASGQQFQIKNSQGTVLATVTVPVTGGWQTWVTTTVSVTLQAGSQTLRIYSLGGGWNINRMDFNAASQKSAAAIPGKIEAENYDAMNGIFTENTTDDGGGKNVGWLDPGNWLDYNATVSSAGTYTVNLRVASPYSGQHFQLQNSSGTVLANLEVPNTGDFQKWTTISVAVTLPTGDQTLRIYSVNGGWNVNWVEFVAGTQAIAAAIPGKIEAERYDAMSGIFLENTTDVGGGKNVGWLDTGDWMDYNTHVTTAGNYTVNFRLAELYQDQQLQLKNSSGTVLGTINIPQTGGYQVWTTATMVVNLPEGDQTLRLYSLNGTWNINWVEFVSGGTVSNNSIALSTLSVTTDQNLNTKETVSIFPNPVREKFLLQLNNSHLGRVDIAIANQAGKTIKTVIFQKSQQVSRFTIPSNELLPGIYFIKVQIGNWTELRKLIKM